MQTHRCNQYYNADNAAKLIDTIIVNIKTCTCLNTYDYYIHIPYHHISLYTYVSTF